MNPPITSRPNNYSVIGAARWGQLADWIARQDRPIPVYHSVCLHAWLWAFRRSV